MPDEHAPWKVGIVMKAAIMEQVWPRYHASVWQLRDRPTLNVPCHGEPARDGQRYDG